MNIDSYIDANTSGDLYSMAQLVRGLTNPTKKQKTVDMKPMVMVRLNSRLGKAKPITLRCLLDSGASGSLISAEHAKKLRIKPTGATQVWDTPGGKLTTNSKCQCTFIMPEFHTDRVIEWDLTVASPNLGAHDMIIGRDILSGLGINFDFQNNTITWDGAVVPMKDVSSPEKLGWDFRQESGQIPPLPPLSGGLLQLTTFRRKRRKMRASIASHFPPSFSPNCGQFPPRFRQMWPFRVPFVAIFRFTVALVLKSCRSISRE